MTVHVNPWPPSKTRPDVPRFQVYVQFKWADGTRSPRFRKVPSHARTERQAREWGERWERELYAAGKPQPAAPAVRVAPTLTEFAPEFLRYCEAERRKPATLKCHRNQLRLYLEPAMGDVRLDALDPDLKSLKFRMLQCQPSSVNLAIATLSALLRYAEREKVIERAVKLTYLKAPPPKPVFYDDETFLRLWRASRVVDERWGGNHELLLLLGGDAGLRCGELLALEPRHLRVKGEAVVIEINEYQKVIGTPKGGSAEDVPISRRLREAIQRADLTGPRVFRRVMVGHNKIKDPVASENALRAILRRVQREAGLPTTGKLHTLRHTLCTRLAMAGAPTRAIQGVARHKRLATTEKYMHLVDGAKAKAVALLDGSDEPEDLSNGCPTDHDEVK